MGTNIDDLVTPLIGRTLALRAKDRAFAARVRHGLNPETEARAYGDIVPHAGGDERAIVPLLRATAIVARHPSLPQVEDNDGVRVPLGQSFQMISNILVTRKGGKFQLDPEHPDTVARRLLQLEYQDLDDAAVNVDRILTIADGLGVAIDYFALAKLFLYWGNGISEKSTQVRRRPIRDYYRTISTQ